MGTMNCLLLLLTTIYYIRTIFTLNEKFLFHLLVEVSGIEPLTSCMPCKRSPS